MEERIATDLKRHGCNLDRMGWLSGWGDDQPDLADARPWQLMQVRREALESAKRYTSRAQSMLDSEWHQVTEERRAYAATVLRGARHFRRMARAHLRLAVQLRWRPQVALRVAQLALDAIAAARAVLEQAGWTITVPMPMDRQPLSGLPPAHGPPARQLSEVHAPCCGVPAPPISWRRTDVDQQAPLPHVRHRRNDSPLRPPDSCGRAGAPSMIQGDHRGTCHHRQAQGHCS